MRKIIGLFVLAAVHNFVQADPASDAFMNIYATICMKHINNIPELEKKLELIPKLPSDKAAPFLQGKEGSAWPVPDNRGLFVVAIPKSTNMCAVFARRLDTVDAKKSFTDIVSVAPTPMKALKKDEVNQTDVKNGERQTLAYTWSIADHPRKIIFMLTTATADTADLQGMATVSLGSD